MHSKSNSCLFVDFVVLCCNLKEQIWLVVVLFMFLSKVMSALNVDVEVVFECSEKSPWLTMTSVTLLCIKSNSMCSMENSLTVGQTPASLSPGNKLSSSFNTKENADRYRRILYKTLLLSHNWCPQL